MRPTVADLAAEEAVLGSIMVDPRELRHVAAIVRAEEFSVARNAEVFVAITALDSGGAIPDVVSVVAELRRRHSKIEPLYVRGLVENVGTPASAAHYAGIVARCAAQRRIIRAAADVIETAEVDGTDPNELVAGAIARFESAHWRGLGDVLSATQIVDAALAEMELEVQESNRVATGLRKLDEGLGGGFAPGRVYLVAARPSVGKSALVGNFALAALRANVPVLFVSLEMTGREVMARLVSDAFAAEGIEAQMRGMLEPEVHGWPLRFRERADLAGLLASVKDLRPGLVLLDYLQLLPTGERFENRQQEIAHISRALKLLAMDQRVPVVAAAQLNRGSKDRPKEPPRLHHLRESGSQEQDADVVMLLDRDSEEDAPETRLAIAKNRHGRTGVVDLVFDGARARFRERFV